MMRSLPSVRMRILIAIAAALLVLVGILVLLHVMHRQTQYVLMEEAVASQPFARHLGEKQRTTRECYPEGRNATCLAVSYFVSDDQCQKILAVLAPDKQNPGQCPFTQTTRLYQDTEITYMLHQHNNQQTLTAMIVK